MPSTILFLLVTMYYRYYIDYYMQGFYRRKRESNPAVGIEFTFEKKVF